MKLSMAFFECGDKDGQLVIYFHGVPGAAIECTVFDRYAKKYGLNVVCFDRFAIDASLDQKSYYESIANEIKLKIGDAPIDIIGFSIGAHVALEVSALLNSQVRRLHLVSAAAPINTSDFIDKMAGGSVFKLAKDRPTLFRLLSQFQKLLASLAPSLLINMLFASAQGKDKVLSKQRDFRTYITPIVKHCFQHRLTGYIRDIRFYVEWSANIKGGSANTFLWHGTKDNWSPFAMASYLADIITDNVTVKAMDELSHYSCLLEAAPKICMQLRESNE